MFSMIEINLIAKKLINSYLDLYNSETEELITLITGASTLNQLKNARYIRSKKLISNLDKLLKETFGDYFEFDTITTSIEDNSVVDITVITNKLDNSQITTIGLKYSIK